MTSNPILKTLFLSAAVFLPVIVTAQQRQPAGASATQPSDLVSVPPAVAALVMLDPTELRSRPTLARGCWVWMFPQTNYRGNDNIAVAGPAEIPSLHTPVGLDWHGKAESLIVGPKASLTVYEVQRFRGKQRTFEPGFKVGNLRKDLGFIQSIDALKLSCKQ